MRDTVGYTIPATQSVNPRDYIPRLEQECGFVNRRWYQTSGSYHRRVEIYWTGKSFAVVLYGGEGISSNIPGKPRRTWIMKRRYFKRYDQSLVKHIQELVSIFGRPLSELRI